MDLVQKEKEEKARAKQEMKAKADAEEERINAWSKGNANTGKEADPSVDAENETQSKSETEREKDIAVLSAVSGIGEQGSNNGGKRLFDPLFFSKRSKHVHRFFSFHYQLHTLTTKHREHPPLIRPNTLHRSHACFPHFA